MTEEQAIAVQMEHLFGPVLMPVLRDPDLTDLSINGPGAVFVERGRGKERVEAGLTPRDLEALAVLAAKLNNADIADDCPIAHGVLPWGQRAAVVRYPAAPRGTVLFSIRNPSEETATPDELEEQGVFDSATSKGAPRRKGVEAAVRLYEEAERTKKWRAFLGLTHRLRWNHVWAGEMGSGKTYDMRSFLHDLPPKLRVLFLQDTDEMPRVPIEDAPKMFYVKGDQGASGVQPEDCLAIGLRMNFGYMIYQELRGPEAFGYLNLLASGHRGSTSVHAESAEQVPDRIRLMVKSHPRGQHLADADVLATVRRCVDVTVFCERDEETGKRRIREVLFDPSKYGSA